MLNVCQLQLKAQLPDMFWLKMSTMKTNLQAAGQPSLQLPSGLSSN